MPIINGPPVGIDNDDEHHEVIIKRQMKEDKNKYTPNNYVFISIGSPVVVLWDDGGWHIKEKGDQNQHDRSYHICITKTGRLVT